MDRIAYPAIGRHAVVGDRRTAALVAADGTVDWLCLPDYDAEPFFGALLDARRGGLWRMGPARLAHGQQTYEEESAVLVTSWAVPEGKLELTDAMLWPEDDRAPGRERQRVLLRRLRCVDGEVACISSYRPGADVRARLRLWSSGSFGSGAEGRFSLRAGEELWAALAFGEVEPWSVDASRTALDDVRRYWREFAGRLQVEGGHRSAAVRTAIVIQLLAYAPSGSVVAAPTTSLPERVGGAWNADYRLSWIRDASLSMAALASLGHTRSGERYLAWLKERASDKVLRQPVFTIRGAGEAPQQDQEGLDGYRGSRPVRFGNHAYEQRQFGSLGFLADCAWVYLQQGGAWRDEHWDVIRRGADHAADVWTEPDNSLWELPHRAHYVMSRVMSWVALERAVRIAQMTGTAAPVARWRSAMDEITADVLAHGWSDRLGAFRQRYGADTLDAATLLMPLLGFLPFDDPRVGRTVERIIERLTIDDFVYRFDPDDVPGLGGEPLGEFEGAFLPCTCWLVAVLAGLGRRDAAERILARVEALGGTTGLLAEAFDPRDGTFRGNMPLLLSHAAHLRAVNALSGAQSG